MSENLVNDVCNEILAIEYKLDCIKCKPNTDLMKVILDLWDLRTDIKGGECQYSSLSLSELSDKLDMIYSMACDLQKKLQHR